MLSYTRVKLLRSFLGLRLDNVLNDTGVDGISFHCASLLGKVNLRQLFFFKRSDWRSFLWKVQNTKTLKNSKCTSNSQNKNYQPNKPVYQFMKIFFNLPFISSRPSIQTSFVRQSLTNLQIYTTKDFLFIYLGWGEFFYNTSIKHSLTHEAIYSLHYLFNFWSLWKCILHRLFEIQVLKNDCIW